MIFNDHFQNFKSYQIPKAQLIIADIPYNLGFYSYLRVFKRGGRKRKEKDLTAQCYLRVTNLKHLFATKKCMVSVALPKNLLTLIRVINFKIYERWQIENM